MNFRTVLGALVLIATTAFITQAVSQDPGDQAEMMKRWTEFSTPGESHEYFKAKVGKYDLAIKMWMAPGTPPAESTGSSEITLVMGGRYVVEKTTGNFMGMPFEGLGIGGYDNMKKKYVGTWVDNMGTGMLRMEGTKQGKVLSYSGEGPDMMRGKYMPIRSVETTIDDDNFKLEMYGPGPNGEEFLAMEILYQRTGSKSAQ